MLQSPARMAGPVSMKVTLTLASVLLDSKESTVMKVSAQLNTGILALTNPEEVKTF